MGWIVMHDLPGTYGNRDHVAIAPSGKIFLLDTKAPGGQITVEKGVLHIRWMEDPDDGYERDFTAKMRGAAAGLADELGEAMPYRPWVTPVVVISGHWEGPPHSYAGVAWVPGKLLAERLQANAGEPNPAKQQLITHALSSFAAASPRVAAGEMNLDAAPAH